MRIVICENKNELGYEAARKGAEDINSVLMEKGEVNVAFVTGLSQVPTLKHLSEENINWDKVNVFLLDEYIGLDKTHPASSINFLTTNLLDKIGKVKSITTIDSSPDKISETLKSLNSKMTKYPLDVVFVCIGENGHLALNDPPADLFIKDPYLVVELENRSRRQQVSEGWFSKFEEVPEMAITMSISEILSAKHIICSCPDQRKAKAVASCLFDTLSAASPASSLRKGSDVDLFLDRQSSCLILSDNRP